MMNSKLQVSESQLRVLNQIKSSDFHDGRDPVNSQVWSWSALKNHSDNAIFGQLLELGLVGSDGYKGDEHCIWLLQAGMDVINQAVSAPMVQVAPVGSRGVEYNIAFAMEWSLKRAEDEAARIGNQLLISNLHLVRLAMAQAIMDLSEKA